jgi:hypothetical protein
LLVIRLIVASPVARPAGSTAFTWFGVIAISPIGVVLPELSVIVALTPPKPVGKGSGGPAGAVKTAVETFAAYMLTIESAVTGAVPLAAETVVTAVLAGATMLVVSLAAVAIAWPPPVKVT